MVAPVPHPRARLAALGQVAELAAGGAAPDVVFAGVVEAASALLAGRPTALVRFEDDGTSVVLAASGGGTPVGARAPADGDSLAARVRRSGRPTRVDDFAGIDQQGVRAGWGVRGAVAVPVVIGGQPWGLLAATSADAPLPGETESRLAELAEVVAAAVSGAQAWSRLRDLAEEHAALRRVAELVARGVPPEELFAAVAAQASRLLQGVAMTLTRFDGDRGLVVMASHRGPAAVGQRIDFGGDTLPDRVRRGALVARVDDYTRERDAGLAVRFGLRASVAAAIVVAGDVWGMLTATSGTSPLPAGTEHRLQQFTELVGAALADVQARTEVQALADEQAALRRLAELAAREAPVAEVLDALAREASWLAGVDFGMVLRFEPDGSTVIEALAGAPESFEVGMRAPASGDGSAWRVWRTGRAARADDLASMPGRWPQMAHLFGFTSSAAAPVRVGESLWGALVVVTRHGPLPRGMEEHLSNFSELAGTVIAAAEARRDLQALAEEQTAVRRVAELVAHGVPLHDVFRAVATEASTLLGGVDAALVLYDEDGAVVVAACNGGTSPAGIARELRVAAAVVVPVVVEGRVWGTLSTSTPGPPPPPGTEERLAPFADLAAAAIATAQNKAKLVASRARVVATADETRRRVQRDVHDSAQQRLVHTIVTLKLAREAVAADRDPAALLDEALRNAERAAADLRDVVRGILPAALSQGGLAAGLESLIDDLTLPVELRVAVPRLPTPLETTAYFVAAEALANVVKHAHATQAVIEITLEGGRLVLEVRDDGSGGADPARGSGLTGLLDRVEAGDGVLRINSPPGTGTTVRAELPVEPPAEPLAGPAPS
jgi:signal transduction histidine kinase